jgi:nucleotide-binding universal stress UspA family protein
MLMHLLVATDGAPEAEGALRLALALHQEFGGNVDVLSVLEPPPTPRFLGFAGLNQEYPAPDPRAADRLRGMAARQIALVGAGGLGWRILVEDGAPGPTIARLARDRGATLILLGLRPRGSEERVRTDSALDVIHVAHVPVILTVPATMGLPTAVLVALDFTTPSLEAARLVAAGPGRNAVIHLAHVALEAGGRAGLREWEDTYKVGAAVRLEWIAAELRSTGASVRTHLLNGDPETEIQRLARSLGVEMIASGSHEYGYLGRAFARSVSTALLRDSACSVMITPAIEAHGASATPTPTPASAVEPVLALP